jgi:hypothetical protein
MNPNSSSSTQEHRIHELRVAHHELLTPSSSTESNQVYIQLSSGSVAMLMDRSVAEARVSRQLQWACEELDTLESVSASNRTTKK